MAQASQKRDLLNPKHLNPENLTFSVFTTDEIKKMSVVEVVTPLLFDTLGNPVTGGLYDKRLGPMSERSDPCGVCYKNSYLCPGHFGHINLPLPLVNPIFNKVISTILKISCLSCHKMQIPSHIKKSIIIQLKLLDLGLITEAQEIDCIIMDLVAQYQTFENIPETETNKIKKYESLANGDDTEVFVNKNVEAIRNQFVYDMLREVKHRKNCMHCKSPINSMKIIKNRIILTQPKLNISTDGDPSTSFLQKVRANESKYITPEESRRYLRKIWIEEKEFMSEIVSVLKSISCEHPTDVFFFEVIPVPPTNVRPVNVVHDRMVEHPQTQSYKQILFNILTLKTIIAFMQNKGENVSTQAKDLYKACKGTSAVEKLNNCWEELQNDVNGLVDKEAAYAKEGAGLKQIIEKKTGVIRMHMMGKRVNFAARSVITPDPNLNIDEIGVPEAFATHLTYPVPVTSWNVEEMRKLIMNGPNVHPGATMVEFEDGKIIRINPSNTTQQESILKRLLTPDKDTAFRGVKIVHRHLQNGDVLLLNRQPTLHKPSIMAHTAKILKGEKTLRLHYANCKAYNADFDGDEMNAHLPQNELARSEGYNIANVANQYLVPKDGTPLSGLIQDHMIAGVRLSLRGRFFNKMDYQQLTYQALSFMTGKIRLLPPAIVKPRELWSGKQILSTILINVIPKDREPINLNGSAKISHKAWETSPPRKWKAGGTPFKNPMNMSEAEIVIKGGQLLVGILDKTHYGATQFGLVHCIYELYGGTYAIRFLSCLAKLFTRFLQQEGFTLGVKDILTVKEADEKRTSIIRESRKIGKTVITTALDLSRNSKEDYIVQKIEESSVTNPKLRAIIDRQYKSSLDSYTNDINKACLPAGLICKFPQNNLQLMVQSGAKGSTVNTMQISCLLGQIELEGKRPPVMISGKSLPSFPVFEFSPRAGGFIDGRFMTGIQPQEFFFHCMAGREGLIDTAVKTSRSGYLQRCLIKHLEGLHVGYDMTVRDSDKSVIQFYYGEDGLEISKAQFLNDKQMSFLVDNRKALVDKTILKTLNNDEATKNVDEYHKQVTQWTDEVKVLSKNQRKSPFSLFTQIVKKKVGENFAREKYMKLWKEADDTIKNSFRQQCSVCPDPINSKYQPDSHFGSINERIDKLIKNFNQKVKKKKERHSIENMMKLKVMQSYCNPGEPVGLLAAQSIGEPSTQMTLNTFHFAGRGDMNVTLGIPRLREILMMASKNIKTPSMECRFLPVPDLEQKAEHLRKTLTRVMVADVLEDVDVTVKLTLQPTREFTYTLRFNFLPRDCYQMEYCVTPKQIMKHVKRKFLAEMFSAILKVSKIKSNVVMMEDEKKKSTKSSADSDDEDDNKTEAQPNANVDDSSDEEVEDSEDAKMTTKHDQAREDQEPEMEEREISDDEAENSEETQKAPDDDEKSVVNSYNFAQNYVEDKKHHLWCQLTFALPLKFKKLDMTNILKDVASKSVIWQVPHINRAITYMKDDVLTLRTDGINITEMFKYNTLLDLNKMYTNDIHRMAETYGIEAAAKIIVKEVKDVFNVYGIKVDPRHLSLIADYMTYNGTFEPLSRKGMETSVSPLQQISFESSLTFLKNAISRGKKDYLDSPSSSLMVGTPCQIGTGVFSLVHKLPTLIKS